MKIQQISIVTAEKNNINFSGKKRNKNKIKTVLPAAALVLSLSAEPAVVNNVNAAEFENTNTEMQWRGGNKHPQTKRPLQNHRTPQYYPHNNYRHHVPPQYPPHNRHVPPHHPPMPPRHHYSYGWILPSLIMMDYINSINELHNYYNSPVSISGVAFNQNDVSNVEKYQEGSTEYTSVTMVDGTNITYPKQYSGRYALVRRKEGGYIFEGLSNAVITGSDRNDKYTLKGCQYTTVDAGSDDRIDNVRVTKYRVIPGGIRQYTQQVEVVANTGDNVNGLKIYDYQTLTYDGY